MSLKTVLTVIVRAMQSVTWDTSNAIVELALLGRRGWWWKLRWKYLQLYWPEGPVRITLKEAPAFKQSLQQLTYGDTLIPTFVHILRAIDAGPKDTIVDLGCGSGLHLLGAALELGVRAVGYDLIAGFIARGRILVRELKLEEQVEFFECDLLKADLSGATIIYVASTVFEPDVLEGLLEKLKALPPGTRIITDDWVLPETDFRLIGGRAYPVSWGWTAVNVFEV